MAKRYIRICNRNTTSSSGLVAKEYMLILGASTMRGLTNQGLGTKMVGIQCMMRGMEFARASHDGDGPYMAWYEKEPYSLGHRAVLVIRRPGKELERIPMTVDVHMFDDGWSENILGNNYPLVREPVLDAADEGKFDIKIVNSMEFAPAGYTCTYVEIPAEKDSELGYNTVEHVVEMFSYYFHRTDSVTWLTKHVGYARGVTVNETRIFITAGDAPIAYVAYSTGDPSPEAAFDWILRETPDRKFASMPKRLLEDFYAAQGLIQDAISKIEDAKDLAMVFQSMSNGGFEKDFRMPDWGWNLELVREATRLAFGNRLPHNSRDDVVAEAAKLRGMRFAVIPQSLYNVLIKAGVKTLAATLGYRAKGTVVIKQMDQGQKIALNKAVVALRKNMPWISTQGHIFMALESDYDGGRHIRDHQGMDVIAINFSPTKQDHIVDIERYITLVILHELVHHRRNENSTENGWHDNDFANEVISLMMPPFAD